MEEILRLRITDEQMENFRNNIARIRFLYYVDLKIDSKRNEKMQNFLELHIGISSKTNGENSVSDVFKAKKHIESVCAVDRIERKCEYNPNIYLYLQRNRDAIEIYSGAVLQFENGELLVWGKEECVTSALYALDRYVQEYMSKAKDFRYQQPNSAKQCTPVTRTSSAFSNDKGHRHKLEAVDSSYDSDGESGQNTTDVFHEDISRTVSETLGAEFAEYINIDTDKLVFPPSDSIDDNSDESSSSDIQDTHRIDFALKLGYTEEQIRIAYQKLGDNAEPNELLAELIRLVETCPNFRKSKQLLTQSKSSPVPDTHQGGGNECSEEDLGLRRIIIDGNNVAMSHGSNEVFSCRGIRICVDWFKQRGHEVTVFVPMSKKESGSQEPRIADQEILFELEKENVLVFTPSRNINGKRVICHDDRYILNLADVVDGIVVSNDNFRDLVKESESFKKTVDERLLMYSFVNDRFMPPDDPLGRHGPSLNNFLKKDTIKTNLDAPICPYLKKCTFGNKCRYQHPERGNMPQKSVSEILTDQLKHQIQERKSRGNKSALRPTVSLPAMSSNEPKKEKKHLSRTSTNYTSHFPRKVMESVPESVKNDPFNSLSNDISQTWMSPPTSAGSSLYCQSDNLQFSRSQQLSDVPYPRAAEVPHGNIKNNHRKLQREPCILSKLDQAKNQSMNQPINQFPVCDARSNFAPADQFEYNQDTLIPSSMSNCQSIWKSSLPPYMINEGHQAVTRIASAPDSYNTQWNSSQSQFSTKVRQASTSDSQLNIPNETSNPLLPQFNWLCPQAPLAKVVSVSQPSTWSDTPTFVHGAIGQLVQPQTHSSPSVSNTIFQSGQQQQMAEPDSLFHLTKIFGHERVETALRHYPNETDPQKLCVKILQMFPPSIE
ncbi:putative ribonuclease ZC3H12C [Nymphon striatum]|nr:putative ribonuclease ZC3H12C [Nymphon striatum]